MSKNKKKTMISPEDKELAEKLLKLNTDVQFEIDKASMINFLGVKYLYLDGKTRVRYGFSFTRFCKTYSLQRKNILWFEVAWNYASLTKEDNLEKIIIELKTDEILRVEERESRKSKF